MSICYLQTSAKNSQDNRNDEIQPFKSCFVVIHVLCNLIISVMRGNECYFLTQRIHNLTLPRWATQDVLDTLKKIASFEVMYSILSHKRKEKARLSGGEDS